MDGVIDPFADIPAYLARVVGHVACPSCNYVMEHGDGVIRCTNRLCNLYQKRFHSPKTLLHPITDG